MIKNQIRGSIIQIASIYGVVAPDQRIYEGSEFKGRPINSPAIYSVSKAGVIALTNYLAAYQTIMNFGAFVMPFVGIFLAELFGFAAILIAGGILCLAGSSIFFWRPLQTADNLFTLTGDGLQDALHPPTNK